MNAGVLRVARVVSLRGIRSEDGSVVRPCSRCHAACLVAPQSVQHATTGQRPVCDVCLPAEPVGPIGSESI